MSRIISFAAALTLPFLLLLGCTLSQRLNGVYEGSRDIKVVPGTDPVVAGQLARVRLEVKQGKAFLSDQGIPVEGRIEYSGDHATFIPESILGAPADKDPKAEKQFTVRLVPRADGSWNYGGQVQLTPKTPSP